MATDPSNTTKRAAPPIPVGTLKANTITSTQITMIVAYIKQYGDAGTQVVLANDIRSKDYEDLIMVYEAVAQGGQATVPPSSAITVTKVPTNWEAAIVDFYNKATSGAFWLRVGEVVLGFGLVWVGLSHVTNGTVPSPATIVKKVRP